MAAWKPIRNLLFMGLFAVMLAACNSTDDAPDDLFQFKDAYVGDNSAVGNLIGRLPGNMNVKQILLETQTEPYGVVIDYEDAMTEEERKEIAIHNASFIFALIQNADRATFNFSEHPYSITRSELQEWYGTELRDISTESELRDLIQSHLDDPEKADPFQGAA